MFRALVIALLAAGCAPDADYGGPVDALPREYRILELEGDIDAGEEVYLDQCYGCHRPNGVEGLAPSLPAYVAESSPRSVIEIAIYGQGRMTAIGARLSDQELADMVAYLFDEWGDYN